DASPLNALDVKPDFALRVVTLGANLPVNFAGDLAGQLDSLLGVYGEAKTFSSDGGTVFDFAYWMIDTSSRVGLFGKIEELRESVVTLLNLPIGLNTDYGHNQNNPIGLSIWVNVTLLDTALQNIFDTTYKDQLVVSGDNVLTLRSASLILPPPGALDPIITLT